MTSRPQHLPSLASHARLARKERVDGLHISQLLHNSSWESVQTFESALTMHPRNLPCELTLAILEALYHTGFRKEFINALRVCKIRNELGAPLLWTYTAINNDNVFRFLRSTVYFREQTLRLVRSLSIILYPILGEPPANGFACAA